MGTTEMNMTIKMAGSLALLSSLVLMALPGIAFGKGAAQGKYANLEGMRGQLKEAETMAMMTETLSGERDPAVMLSWCAVAEMRFLVDDDQEKIERSQVRCINLASKLKSEESSLQALHQFNQEQQIHFSPLLSARLLGIEAAKNGQLYGPDTESTVEVRIEYLRRGLLLPELKDDVLPLLRKHQDELIDRAPKDARVANIFASAGDLQVRFGNYAEGRHFFEQAIAACRVDPASGASRMAALYEGLASAYYAAGDLTGGDAALTQADQARGTAPPVTGTTAVVREIGQTWREQGNAAARRLAEAELKKVRSGKHPDPDSLVQYNVALANLSEQAGDDVRAAALYKETLALMIKNGKGAYFGTVELQSGLAQVYRRQRLYAQARPLQLVVYGELRKRLGVDNPETMESAAELAFLDNVTGHAVEAEPLYRELLKQAKSRPAPSKEEISEFTYGLALAQATLGHDDEADASYQAVIGLWEADLADPRLSEALGAYATFCRKLGRSQQADAIEQRIAGLKNG